MSRYDSAISETQQEIKDAKGRGNVALALVLQRELDRLQRLDIDIVSGTEAAYIRD